MATSPALSTHVFKNIPKGFYPDHAYEDHPTFMMLENKNQKQNGGLSYDPNRIATKDNTSVFYAGTSLDAVISSASQTSALLAETFPWVNVVTPITITYEERLKASGDPELVRIDMADAKKAQAKLEHLDAKAETCMTGTGGSNTAIGLHVMCSATATYGGVVPGTDADWAGNMIATATVLTGPSTLTDAYIPCMHKGHKPTWISTGATLWAKCSNIFQMGIQTQNKDSQDYSFGIKKIKFMFADIVMDRDVASGDMDFYDMDEIVFKQSNQFYNKFKMPVEPTDGTNIHLSNVGYVNSSFIIGSNTRRSHGGYDSLT